MKGFTLIELSIVLVIIGLLISSILTGRELIKQSKFRCIVRDKEEVSRAINTFRAKYKDLPGDTKKATTFFGADPGCGSTRTSSGTCNGNGNGIIAAGGEGYLSVQHLYLADMLSFPAPGYDVISNGSEVGVDIPASTFGDSVGYNIFDYVYVGNVYPCTDSSISWMYVGCYKNMILFGKFAVSDYNITPFLTSSDAFAFDTKFDDGKPGTGSVFARPWGGCEDDTTNTATNTANYKNTNSAANCQVFWRNVY